MNTIQEIQRLNEQELEAGISITGSWHNDYNDTAYIFIGGLPLTLSEGDVVTIFSQYGTPVHVKLARDKETGKSKGFGWLKYEDQRSTVLAVDNFNGISVLGRIIKVDHAYYMPQEDEDIETLGKELRDREHEKDGEEERDKEPMGGSMKELGIQSRREPEREKHKWHRHHNDRRESKHRGETDRHSHQRNSYDDPELMDPMRDYFREKKRRRSSREGE